VGDIAVEPGGIPVDTLKWVWAVAPLSMWLGRTALGQATGFFWSKDSRLFLITNRHVVVDEKQDYYPDRIQFRVDRDGASGSPLWVQEPLYQGDGKPRWKELTPDVDIAAIELDASVRSHRIAALSSDLLAPDDLVMDIGSDASVIGYPLGFYDDVNNLPITRDAVVASDYQVPFRNNEYFLIDARLHRGTSGSPVILKPTYTLRYRDGSLHLHTDMPHTYFLGIHSGEWQQNGEPLGLSAVWYRRLLEKLIQ
jgi:hypothetical protein